MFDKDTAGPETVDSESYQSLLKRFISLPKWLRNQSHQAHSTCLCGDKIGGCLAFTLQPHLSDSDNVNLQHFTTFTAGDHNSAKIRAFQCQ